ncbi:single-stranded DNA-binding protein [Pedobacter sp.]|uniref:single-stranded DNA-binding protein n=1 Tax=Pedobacter sp. TaxID=1411316 RepID=UPI003D7F2016
MSTVNNSVRLTGFAGTDPVFLKYGDNKKLARVNLKVSESYYNSNGDIISNTRWVNLVFFNKRVALVIGVITKGSVFTVEGRLVTRQYTDKNGKMRVHTEVVVNRLEVLSETLVN